MPSGSRGQQRQRQRLGVREVVEPGAHLRTGEIAEPGQVGDEEQRRDQPPGLPGAGEEGETGSGDGQPFDPQPGQWPAGDHTRCYGGDVGPGQSGDLLVSG